MWKIWSRSNSPTVVYHIECCNLKPFPFLSNISGVAIWSHSNCCISNQMMHWSSPNSPTVVYQIEYCSHSSLLVIYNLLCDCTFDSLSLLSKWPTLMPFGKKVSAAHITNSGVIVLWNCVHINCSDRFVLIVEPLQEFHTIFRTLKIQGPSSQLGVLGRSG